MMNDLAQKLSDAAKEIDRLRNIEAPLKVAITRNWLCRR
jgi:hypothetical protein